MPRAAQTVARFAVRTEADVDALRRILIGRGGRIGPPATGALQSLRLDTRDGWFRRAGLSLRILHDGAGGRVELESGHWTTGQPARRIRLSAPYSRPAPRFPGFLPPCGLSRWMARILPDRPELTVVGRTDLARTSYSSTEARGVQFRVSADRTISRRSRAERTVELALETGTPTDLAALCRRLERLPGWTRRADLEPVPAARRAGRGRASPAFPVQLRRAIQAQWALVLAETPGARAGLDPERIHRMRLAVRRLRSLLRLLPPGGRMKEIGLKPLGDLLGRIRDLDIVLGRLAPRSGRRAPEPAADYFRARLERRRDRAHRMLVRFLDSGRFRDGTAARSGPRADPSEPDARARFDRQIRRTLKAVRRAGREGSFPGVHRLRIRGKQTRYILEALGPVLGESASNAALALDQLHHRLGVFQDEVAFRDLLKSLARQPRLAPPLAQWARDRAAGQADRVERRLRALGKDLRKTGDLKRKLSTLLVRAEKDEEA